MENRFVSLKRPIIFCSIAWVAILAVIFSRGGITTNTGSTDAEIRTTISENYAEIEYRPSAVWDEENLLKNHFSHGITFAQMVFAEHPGIQRVLVKTYYKLQDVNGDEKESLVMKHIFARAPFMEVHWDRFRYSPVFDQINKSLEGAGYIHPAIAKKITTEYLTEKMFYTP